MDDGVVLRELENVDRTSSADGVAVYTFLTADPQFALEPSATPAGWGASWHLLHYRIEAVEGSVVAPCLYPDYGSGYSEATRIDLPPHSADGVVEFLVVFPSPVKTLRFDPSASEGVFRLSEVDLHPVSRLVALGHMLRVLRRAEGVKGLRGFLRMARDVLRVLRNGGVRVLGDHLRTRYVAVLEQPPIRYADWLRMRGAPPQGLQDGPLVSVIMPTCNTPLQFLREAIDSVRAQRYRNWEFCIADDASDAAGVLRILDEYSAKDARIKVVKRGERGGISCATNDALALSSGEYLAFLDHDDVLTPNALGLLVEYLEVEGADVAYSDHDHLSESGERCDPFFKPDWSSDLFLSQMYLAHLVMIRASLMRDAGALDPAYDGAQDYDLVLRCWRRGARFVHVPEILYHWRRHAGSTAANPGSKPYAHLAGQRALQRHVDEVYPGAVVAESPWLFCYDTRFSLPSKRPLVSIIIPTRDGIDLLDPCIKSILEKTVGADYEILIVDNGSRKPETAEWFERACAAHPSIRVIALDIPFNWSLLNNRAAELARGEVLVFLNNDTEVISPDWLVRLAENALRPDVATCGPLLLYPDGTIQHAGVVVGLGGWADHVFKGLPAHHQQHLFVSPLLRRNVLAVTGACVAVSAATFRELDGFDETFLICGSDVDLGIRGHKRGLKNVYLPEVRLYHHESKTRDAKMVPENDFIRSAESYGEFRTAGDPFYSVNLDTSKFTPAFGRMP